MESDKFNYSRHAEKVVEHLQDLVALESEVKQLKKQLAQTKKQVRNTKGDLEAAGYLNVRMARLAAEIEEKQGQYLDLIRKKDRQVHLFAAANEVLDNFEPDKIN